MPQLEENLRGADDFMFDAALAKLDSRTQIAFGLFEGAKSIVKVAAVGAISGQARQRSVDTRAWQWSPARRSG